MDNYVNYVLAAYLFSVLTLLAYALYSWRKYRIVMGQSNFVSNISDPIISSQSDIQGQQQLVSQKTSDQVTGSLSSSSTNCLQQANNDRAL